VPRTLCPPYTDRGMWKRLLRAVHPDHGGDSEVFIWANHVREQVLDDSIQEPKPRVEREPPPHPHNVKEEDRIEFDQGMPHAENLDMAASLAEDLDEPYATLFGYLADCHEAPATDHVLRRAERHGATYRQLAYIAHLASMSTKQRSQWYRIAEGASVSQRMAGHIIKKLKS
jgi:hypothetical protein